MTPTWFKHFTLALVIVGLVGCSSDRPVSSAVSATIRPTELQPYAVPGETLVLPATVVASGSRVDRIESVSASLEGVGALETSFFWAWTEQAEHAPDAGDLGAWLDAPRQWQFEEDPTTGGVVFTPTILIQLPRDAYGSWLDVNGTHLRPVWIQPTGLLWQLDLKDGPSADPGLLEAVRPEAADPARRWRADLAADALLLNPPWPPFDDPAVQALAEQQTIRWRAGLDRLAATDPWLARSVRRYLTLVCDNGTRLIPAWPTAPADLRDLLATLLDPVLDDPQRADRVRAWLNAQPRQLIWTVADGDVGNTTLGIANLSTAELRVEIRWQRSSQAPAMGQFQPGAIGHLQLNRPSAGGNTELLVQAGPQQSTIRIAPAPAACNPPGYVFGPFAEPLNLTNWRSSRYLQVMPQHATRALLRNTIQGWEIFIECRIGEEDRLDGSAVDPRGAALNDFDVEALYIFMGSGDAPSEVLAVTPNGDVTDFLRPDESFAVRPHVNDSHTAWSVTIPLQRGWTRPNRPLRLGMLRSFSSGKLPASFPQPMFPWNVDPGRVNIDLSAWDNTPSPPAISLYGQPPLRQSP